MLSLDATLCLSFGEFMDTAQIAIFRNILNDLRGEILQRKDDSIVSEKLPDAIDAAADHMEKQVTTKFIARKNFFLRKIDHALKKLEDNTYGECESCGEAIGIKRLLVRPTASLCIYCKQEQEDIERKEKELLKGGYLDDWD